jgi:benzoyl-CoA 2,3-dioxygenase component A
MEAGVLDAMRDISAAEGIDWSALHAEMKRTGRLHFETY